MLQSREAQVLQDNVEFGYHIGTGCYKQSHEAQVLQDNVEFGYHICTGCYNHMKLKCYRIM